MKMVDTYPQKYLLRPAGIAVDHRRNIDRAARDPIIDTFRNVVNTSAKDAHFHEEYPISAFIPEPRISVARMRELPLFFSQSQNFSNDDIPLQPGNDSYNEHLFKPGRSQFRAPTPLQLQPGRMLEKPVGNRFSNIPDIYANDIMSENVQQRYLFSKKPKYGPLSVPVTIRYHPAVNSVRVIQDRDFFDPEESQNYNFKARSFGRRSSDVREPMPKLGQGDARLGDTIPFGEEKASAYPKINNLYPTSTYNLPASPPSLTFSSNSPRSPATIDFLYDDFSRLGTNKTCTVYPERSTPILGTLHEKHSYRPRNPCTDTNHKPYISGSHKENHMSQMSTNKVTSPPVETGSALTSLKKMGSTYQFDATAAAFQPASLKIHPSNQPNFPRIRPTRWRVQCKWTLACVDNCRYGRKCLWGHEGDEYLDEPGVKHTFKSEVNNQAHYNQTCYDQTHQDQTYYFQIDHDQTRYDQVAFYNPGEYSTYSTSGYSVQQNSNYGIHQYVNGSMPDFSWVDGAANVDGCLDMKNYPVFEYADTQVQDPAGFYGDTSVFDPENIYGDGHTESQSGNQVGTSTGSIKKKKKHNKKFKKAAAKPIGDMIERAGMDGMALTEEQLQNVQARGAHFEMDGGQIEKQLQDLQIKDAGFGKSLEKTAVSATDDKTAI